MKEGECTANRFSTVQITVQYRCIFVQLFGRYSLQLDNKYISLNVLVCSVAVYFYSLFVF